MGRSLRFLKARSHSNTVGRGYSSIPATCTMGWSSIKIYGHNFGHTSRVCNVTGVAYMPGVTMGKLGGVNLVNKV